MEIDSPTVQRLRGHVAAARTPGGGRAFGGSARRSTSHRWKSRRCCGATRAPRRSVDETNGWGSSPPSCLPTAGRPGDADIAAAVAVADGMVEDPEEHLFANSAAGSACRVPAPRCANAVRVDLEVGDATLHAAAAAPDARHAGRIQVERAVALETRDARGACPRLEMHVSRDHCEHALAARLRAVELGIAPIATALEEVAAPDVGGAAIGAWRASATARFDRRIEADVDSFSRILLPVHLSRNASPMSSLSSTASATPESQTLPL